MVNLLTKNSGSEELIWVDQGSIGGCWWDSW